uniref:TF_AP-2 domain-containing protein n=1 Tax=Heterorhabditis bacteriophora TaxID=37862 RepID=A0A1I7XI55_HETBA
MSCNKRPNATASLLQSAPYPFANHFSVYGGDYCAQTSYSFYNKRTSNDSGVTSDDSVQSLDMGSIQSSSVLASTISSSNNEVLYEVPSRMGCIGKYEVTLSELRRRAGAPESLNCSLLGSYLRLAKSKEVGKELRDKLEKHGLNVTSRRRKGMQVSTFTYLVEEEAMKMSTELDQLVRHYFPAKALVRHLQKRNSSYLLEERKRDILGAVRILDELNIVLDEVQTPLCKESPPPNKDKELQEGVNLFSLVSGMALLFILFSLMFVL